VKTRAERWRAEIDQEGDVELGGRNKVGVHRSRRRAIEKAIPAGARTIGEQNGPDLFRVDSTLIVQRSRYQGRGHDAECCDRQV